MIRFSDNPEKAVETIRVEMIRQLQESNLLKLEDYEDLFQCEISGLNVPTKLQSKQEMDDFRRKLKATIIATSPTEFSFYDIKKIFNEPKSLVLFSPYSKLKNVRIADIPKDAMDKDGNNIYKTLLKDAKVKQKDLKKENLLFTGCVKRVENPTRNHIDTQSVREDLAKAYMMEHPEKELYRETLDIGFQAIHNTYHNRTTRNLSYESQTIRKVKTDIILQVIRDFPDMSYEAIGKVFNRNRMQIRDIARGHGLYRHENGKSRANETVEGIPWNQRKKKNQEDHTR